MRRVPRTVLLALSLGALGCESTQPMSNPFQPVKVAPQGTATSAGASGSTAADPRFAGIDEPQTFSSEELRAAVGTAGTDGGADGANTSAGTLGADASAPTTPGAAPTGTASTGTASTGPAAAPDAMAAPGMGMSASLGGAGSLGWAVRLVSIVPGAQPPRAILGLSDGQEIVVTPGAMVPEAGLVVLSVGTRAVQVARITGVGDHATVQSMDLSPQY